TGAEEMQASSANITLDSSIVGNKGITVIGSGSCGITRSRGPVDHGTPGDLTHCDDFQLPTAPSFVSPITNDLHLAPAGDAEVIDQGAPANPVGPDTLDYDLEKRTADGDGDCLETRDIGADEVLPTPPTVNFTSGPANSSTINTSSTSFSFTNSNTCPG